MDWFAERILHWFDTHGRKDLPWQHDPNAYRVWVSEIMLQQTQVATVIGYYERFMTRFPTVQALAGANLDEVLHYWSGLGYYARGRNLHATAKRVVAEHQGAFPTSVEELVALPGIGRSTAGAIAAISAGVRAPILDGNVKRVLARFHAVAGYPGESAVARTLWRHAESHTPHTRLHHYTQAIMDLGATVCTRRPNCQACPLHERCAAFASGSVAEFPGRKPGKEKPTRRVRMFLIQDPDGACLLEQRPASGIWGGLWTPPERNPDHTTTQMLAELGESSATEVADHTATPLRHTFTHFHLDIEPVHVRLPRRPAMVADGAGWQWYTHGQRIGLSAPALKLIEEIQS